MTITLRSSSQAVGSTSQLCLARNYMLVLQRSHVDCLAHTSTVAVNKRRCYATQKPNINVRQRGTESTKLQPSDEKELAERDTVNPPETSRAPPLVLPEKGDNNRIYHLYKTGRAYGAFYWKGVKLTWTNHKSVKPIRKRLIYGSRSPPGIRPFQDIVANALIEKRDLTRSEFQQVMRERHDFGKVPLFGLMFVVFGEWLPLIVPFIPGVVPKTCRFPKQVEGMRKQAEERRRQSFRSGMRIPDEERFRGLTENMKPAEGRVDPSTSSTKSSAEERNCSSHLHRQLVKRLSKPEVLHVSTSLGLHRKLWDRLTISPPRMLLDRSVVSHLQYLGIDDTLLLRQPESPELVLEEEEVRIACEERGIDVVGRPMHDLRSDMGSWLKGRKEDGGTGRKIMRMLFVRPNSYDRTKP